MENEKMVEVVNRSGGSLGYYIPDLKLNRVFAPNETKTIAESEIKALYFTSGGKQMLRDDLLVKDADLVDEIVGEVEPEYFYSESDVKNLLLTGSVDALKDCLEFGTEGVKAIAKNLAVELRINDISKREAIKEILGFDVTKAIEVIKASEEGVEKEAPKQRRVSVNTEETAAPKRRTSTPNYKVVSTSK